MASFKSPLEDVFHLPPFLDPLINLVYLPTTQVAKILDLPTGRTWLLTICRSIDVPRELPRSNWKRVDTQQHLQRLNPQTSFSSHGMLHTDVHVWKG